MAAGAELLELVVLLDWVQLVRMLSFGLVVGIAIN